MREKVRRGLVGINRRAIEVARDGKEALGLEEPAVRYLRQPTGTKPLCEKASCPLDSARMVERHISFAATRIVVSCQRRMPSRMVDLPVPFSPTMIVIARSKDRSNPLAKI